MDPLPYRPLRAKYIHSYHIYPNREKNFQIFSGRHFEGILSPVNCGIVAQLAAKVNKENWNAFCRFPTDEKQKGGMDNGQKEEKTRPQLDISAYAARAFLSLVAIRARIYQLV